MTAFQKPVTTEAELRELIGEPRVLALAKQLGTLDVHCREFIARSPFLLLATSNASCQCDVSPKGDAPGFVLVLDEVEEAFIHTRPPGATVEDLDRQRQESYTKRLY